MAQVVINEASLSDIAQALRSKLGTNETFKPSQMGDGVRRLPSASSAPVLITKQISANGTYAASGDNADGYSSVEVSVANSYSASDEGKVVDNGALVSQTSRNITDNGTYDTTTNNEVVVSVSGGGGGAPIYSGTSAPSSSLGNDEDLYVQYEVESAQFDHTYKITNTFRKVSGSWTAYTEPEPPTKGVHIWTKSMGGNDAAMYVQKGYWDVDNDTFVATGETVSVIYTSVQSSNTFDCYGLCTLGYPSKWYVYATDSVTDGTSTFSNGDLVKTWRYTESVDFYVYKGSPAPSEDIHFEDYLDYIQSDGNQYIDTGYYPNENTKFEAIINVTANPTAFPNAWGVRSNVEYSFSYTSGNLYCAFSSGQVSMGSHKSIGTKYYVEQSKTKVKQVTTDQSSTENSFTGGSTTSSHTLKLFTLGSSSGGDFGSATHTTMKLHLFRIYEGNTLIMELLPAIDGNNEVCLQDTVSGNYFRNSGSGSFTFGTDT